MVSLEKSERMRLLEIAAECGASPMDIVRVAAELECYVLGTSPQRTVDQSWDGIPSSDTKQ